MLHATDRPHDGIASPISSGVSLDMLNRPARQRAPPLALNRDIMLRLLLLPAFQRNHGVGGARLGSDIIAAKSDDLPLRALR